MKTIKITTMFGKEKDINLEEFVKRWTTWAQDFDSLVGLEEFKKFEARVKNLATDKFMDQVERDNEPAWRAAQERNKNAKI